MNNKCVLIVNFGFPPNPGIGGRRWAMFADGLTKSGYTVHVLCNRNRSEKRSLYSDLVECNKFIHVHHLPIFYPTTLRTIPTNPFSRLAYMFWSRFMNIYSKGSPFDNAIFSKRAIQKKALRIMNEHGIDNVIVSGAPFRLCYYFAEIKAQIPKLIIDLRDPWTWGGGYGYSTLSHKKLAFEKMMEATVMDKADLVYVPVEIMQMELNQHYPQHANKIEVLPHGYDQGGIPVRQWNDSSGKQPLKLIFIGSIYDGIGHYFSEISKAISDPETDVTLDIYSRSTKYQEMFIEPDGGASKVRYHAPLPPNQLFKMLKDFDYCLIVHPDYGKDNISTKFYEIIYSNTPIAYIGKEGLTSKFVVENSVGTYIHPKEIFRSILHGNFSRNYNHAPTIDIDRFSFQNLTKQLIASFVD